MVKIKRFCRGRKGFSLIEVIIALAILVVVVLALEFSYYSYYRNVTDLRIKTIGQNLGQLQLEDIQNLASSVIDSDIIDSAIGYPPNYPADHDEDLHNSSYNSGKIDGEFLIEGLTAIPTTSPSDLLLPDSIYVEKEGANDYTLTLYAETFPNYRKQVVITDKTPGLSGAQKIFTIEVTVYWDVNGVEKSITITGEKSYARSTE